jgi:hypothetical protein
MCPDGGWQSSSFEVYDVEEFFYWTSNYWPEAHAWRRFGDGPATINICANYEFSLEFWGECPTNLPEYRRNPDLETEHPEDVYFTPHLDWMGDLERGIPAENAFIEELAQRIRHDSRCIIQLWTGDSALGLVINGGDEHWEERTRWVSLEATCVQASLDLAGGRKLLMAIGY